MWSDLVDFFFFRPPPVSVEVQPMHQQHAGPIVLFPQRLVPDASACPWSHGCGPKEQNTPLPLRFPCKMDVSGCASKNRYQDGTLVRGNMDQNLRRPSCLILSHTHLGFDPHPPRHGQSAPGQKAKGTLLAEIGTELKQPRLLGYSQTVHQQNIQRNSTTGPSKPSMKREPSITWVSFTTLNQPYSHDGV